MHATIRSYHGVDQNRTAEMTTKVKETLVPQLQELPGFKGYYLVEAGNGVFTSLGLFETPEQGMESTKFVPACRAPRIPPRDGDQPPRLRHRSHQSKSCGRPRGAPRAARASRRRPARRGRSRRTAARR